jgi:hypothetical protein
VKVAVPTKGAVSVASGVASKLAVDKMTAACAEAAMAVKTDNRIIPFIEMAAAFRDHLPIPA